MSQSEHIPRSDEVDSVEHTGTSESSLARLLSALATGVRAVQGLPVEEDFQFYQSLPEFASNVQKAQRSLMDGVQGIIRQIQMTTGSGVGATTTDEWGVPGTSETRFSDIEDINFWQECADVCEFLMERIENELLVDEDHLDDSALETLQTLSDRARHKIQSSHQQMVSNTLDIPKPQLVYGYYTIDNSRTKPFIPCVHPGKPHAVVPLDVSLQPGSGLRPVLAGRTPSLVTPTHHVPHVYQTEILNLSWDGHRFRRTESPPTVIPVVQPLTATWIDTEPALQRLAWKLETVREVALDLEAHSYRSFAGLVCLLQISIRSTDGTGSTMENYLVDTLALRPCINPHLAPMLANPDIVKVFHGGDSDIVWLQRDFGCYVVHMFDTGRASRALRYPSASLAHLLSRHVNIQADKSYQMADWRQRPLPPNMQQYAIQDTHYLLDIKDKLCWELQNHATGDLLETVWMESQQVSLRLYVGEPFDPMGFRKLLVTRGRRRQDLNAVQQAVLKALWNWRDATARAEDESTQYVCTNGALIRMALAVPNTTTALVALFNPVPKLVLQYAPEILNVIKVAQNNVHDEEADVEDDEEEEDDDEEEEEEEDDDEDDDDEVLAALPTAGTRPSVFFKPATVENPTSSSLRDGIMSPVLGTEALYKQAGWMTPCSEMVDLAATTSTDNDDTVERQKNLLSVHTSNQDYHSKNVTDHSLGFMSNGGRRGKGIDGFGTVRESSQSPVEERAIAKNTAKATVINMKQSIPVVLGMITTPDVDDDENHGLDEDYGRGRQPASPTGHTPEELEEEFIIPRSMREIYKISNRNRRNKKAGSPSPERGVTPTNEKEREELLRAEALLRERGAVAAGYFDAYGSESIGKRPRTKSHTGRESEESVPPESSNAVSAEEDLAFMQEIGWTKDEKEAVQLLKDRYGKANAKNDETDGGEDSSAGQDGTKDASRPSTANSFVGFDYSGSVGIMPGGSGGTPSSSNPFFTGAALTGGPLTQSFAKFEQSRPRKAPNQASNTPGNSKGKQGRGRQQERPEKKDGGRAHVYRKR